MKEKKITELQGICIEDQATLKEYAIITVEQLLGVTFGFTSTSLLSLLKEPQKLVEVVRAHTAQQEIQRYTQHQPLPAMGLRTEGEYHEN